MIFISHGVLRGREARRISHDLMLDEEAYVGHLRRTQYVPLADALAGHGDALTFDDATHAAVRGALIARSYGHPVTMFVNGWHVESQAPYFPFQLSAMLDDTRKSSCTLLGRRWSLRTFEEKRFLRRHLKTAYMGMCRTEKVSTLVQNLSQELGVSEMEHALHTAGRSDLLRAVAAGVELQNHGWMHLNPELYLASELKDDIERNREWLRELTGRESEIYAPPFGKVGSHADEFARTILIARRDSHGSPMVNRVQLSTHEVIAGSAGRESARPMVL